MKYTNIITFNSRALFLWFSLLVGQLWLYIFFEIFILGAIFLYMQHRHEKLCKELTAKIESGYDFR